jgi:preprotein translocase subunit SecG
MIENIVTVIHVLTCLLLILVILLQSGKGGGVSAAFGGGAGAALGQRSAATVLGKVTAIAATVFMITSMVLAVYSTPGVRDRTINDVDGAATGAAAGEEAKAGGEEAAPGGEETKAGGDEANAEPGTPAEPNPSDLDVDLTPAPTPDPAEDLRPRGVPPGAAQAPASQDTAEDAR